MGRRNFADPFWFQAFGCVLGNARFSFAHGGKDGHPCPVDRITFDRSIQILRQAVERARLGDRGKLEAIKRQRV